MPEVRERIVLQVSRERAWDFIADIRNAPRWMFGVREVGGSLSPPLQQGDRLRIRLVAGGKLADSEWVVGTCDRPRLITSSGRAMGATADLKIECRDLGGGKTEVSQTLRYELPGGMLGALAARFGVSGIMVMQAHRSLSTLAGILSPAGEHRETPGGATEPGGSEDLA